MLIVGLSFFTLSRLLTTDSSRFILISFPTRRSSDLTDTITSSITGSANVTVSSPQPFAVGTTPGTVRSEEHTSELQSLTNIVCRLLLDNKRFIVFDTLTLADDRLEAFSDNSNPLLDY